MVDIHRDDPATAETGTETDEDELDLFDVHRWFESYLADEDAQAEHADHAGVPFH